MATAKDNVNKEYRNWVRLFMLIDYSARKPCSDVLFKKGKRPTDGVQFYRRLECEQSRICQFVDEHQILCLFSRFRNHGDFDLALFMRIIEMIFGSKYESLVKDLRTLSNRESKELSNTDFGTIWKCLADILQNQGFDLSLVDDLKDCDLFSDQQVQDIVICIQGRWISATCDISATVLSNTFCWSETLTNT